MSLTHEERRARLQTCIDTIIQEAMDLWWEHATKRTTACVSQLQKALPCLAELNPVYRQEQPLLSWLAYKVRDTKWNVRSAAAKALGQMGDRAATGEVLSMLVESVQVGGDYAFDDAIVLQSFHHDAIVLQSFHQRNLRLYLHEEAWKALTIWRLARGERNAPTPLPPDWKSPVLIEAGMCVWTCACRPPRLFSLPMTVTSLSGGCEQCGEAYRPVEEKS